MGRYFLYHADKKVYFRGTVRPIPDGRRLYFTWEGYGRSGWKTLAVDHFAMNAKGTVTVYIDSKALVEGVRYRIDCEFQGDTGHLADTSPWSYFRVTG